MYTGQGQDNRLPLPDAALDRGRHSSGWPRTSTTFYDRRFGYRAPEIPIFVSSVSVVGSGRRPMIVAAERRAEPRRRAPAPSGPIAAASSCISTGGTRHEARRSTTAPSSCEGDEIAGPAVIDDKLGTIVVNPGATARVGAATEP